MRRCACSREDVACECASGRIEREGNLQRTVREAGAAAAVPAIVGNVLRSAGEPLALPVRAVLEPRFGYDFSHVRVHTDAQAADSANEVNALAYTVGSHVVFAAGTFAPRSTDGLRLLAHELTHVIQQRPWSPSGNAMPSRVGPADSSLEGQADAVADAIVTGGTPAGITRAAPLMQLRAAPYIKKITVHLAPPQSADLEWVGTPPATATGSDHFTVSTGKGYGDPGDPPGTCRRNCCSDPMTQCAPPHNQPGRVGSCCTYFGSTFWTGRPEAEHGGPGGWKYWTPIQPYYSSRSIALHQHPDVTGQPIGHGCVRMAEENARRIAEFSNGRKTNVTIDGRAAPVHCPASRQCGGAGSRGGTGGGASLEIESVGERVAALEPVVPGLEGEMS